jgi:hypothetical protein
MTLISIIKHKAPKLEQMDLVSWVKGIIRNARKDDPSSMKSKLLLDECEYKWFEIYKLDKESFEFKLEDEIELYVGKNMLAEGHFHEVNLATQRRKFVKEEMSNGEFTKLREIELDPPKKWVIKRVKDYKHLSEVPNDIAKQYLAVTMADAFSKVLKQTFPHEEIFLKYIQPKLAMPLFKQRQPYIYEIEEYQGDLKFENYNRPKNDKFSTKKDSPYFGEVRLPHTFAHWTNVATGGNYMIVDIQGWKLEKG